ncbi:DUF3857 domain-containing protein [Lacihabitans soyangensis]|uniref:DUF3857 domain-containing protein n=1 Tax=Lacihabitans soyangensis TaxID=869394 RepID=A0AAE3H0P4_9BACT|nr:DUF3857 domain-containing protein [Lacihabitans soyangensis]MCP9762140.1 DUF3857 domain-containing protein [Lacihabitans soyangensis]
MNKIVIFSLLITQGVWAQSKENLDYYRAQYPSNDILTISQKEEVNIKIVDGKVQILTDYFNENLYLTNKASIYQYADQSIVYSPFFQEINNIEAATFVPSEKGPKKLNVKEITTEKENSKGIFYDDYLVKKFTFQGLQQGAVSTLKYQETIKDPYMMPSFIFGNYLPIQNAEFSVTFPSNIKVNFKKFGDFSNIVFTESKSKNKTTYTWKASNLKDIPYESKSLNIRYLTPSVQLFIENYTIDNKTIEVLSDERKLFNYYASLVRNLNASPDKALIHLTDSLTNGKSDLEKIKTVYYWVQDYVKYIAFEDGMGGFIPREASQVFSKRYGDCKDMASLITTMLKIANVKDVHLGWIGTRDIPFKYAENPSLSVDNHMIAVAKVDNQWVFLDATDDRIDYGLPTSHIQGKQCMIKLTDTEYQIIDVPVVKSNINARKDKTEIKIEGNNLVGIGKTTLDGLWKTEVKYYLSNYSEKEKQDYTEALFKVGNNKCKVGPVTINNLKDREKLIGFDYSFQVPDFVKKIDNELYFNPHIYTHITADNLMQKSRKNDFVNDYAWKEESEVEIEVPENHELVYLPESSNYTGANFGYALSYEQKSGKIILKQITYLNTLVLKKSEFEEWNKMINKITTAHNELIGFKKK